MEAEYAVYDNDEFKFIGTKQEIVERLKIKGSSFNWYVSKAGRERYESIKRGKRRVIIKIDDEVWALIKLKKTNLDGYPVSHLQK